VHKNVAAVFALLGHPVMRFLNVPVDIPLRVEDLPAVRAEQLLRLFLHVAQRVVQLLVLRQVAVPSEAFTADVAL